MRTSLHILILPLLAVALTVGSQSSVCDALALFGLDVHHRGGETSLCTTSVDHQEEGKSPCTEECDSKLTEASNPVQLKTPQPCLLLFSHSDEFRAFQCASDRDQDRVSANTEPPDLPRSRFSPPFTGRFLI